MKKDSKPFETTISYAINKTHLKEQSDLTGQRAGKWLLNFKGFQKLRAEAADTSFGLMASSEDESMNDSYKGLLGMLHDGVFEVVKNSIDAYLDSQNGKAYPEEKKPEVTVKFAINFEDNNIGLTMTDNGPGFPPGFADKVIKSTKKLDGEHSLVGERLGGAGLGSKQLDDKVSNFGGNIVRDNNDVKQGGGARVKISVPIVAVEKYNREMNEEVTTFVREQGDIATQSADSPRPSPVALSVSSEEDREQGDIVMQSPDSSRSSPFALSVSSEEDREQGDIVMQSPDSSRSSPLTLTVSSEEDREQGDIVMQSPDSSRSSPLTLSVSSEEDHEQGDIVMQFPDSSRSSPLTLSVSSEEDREQGSIIMSSPDSPSSDKDRDQSSVKMLSSPVSMFGRSPTAARTPTPTEEESYGTNKGFKLSLGGDSD